MNNPTISSSRILEAVSYYQKWGFKLIDVPFLVQSEVSSLTKPTTCSDLVHSDNLVYVGSAEQSFIQMDVDGTLENGNYMAITPCYRDEEVYDDTHFKMFLKLELITLGDIYYPSHLANHALDFFRNYTKCDKVKTTEGSETYDIVDSNGIELGSYGQRIMPSGRAYVYGTGIAEPRLSISIEML